MWRTTSRKAQKTPPSVVGGSLSLSTFHLPFFPTPISLTQPPQSPLLTLNYTRALHVTTNHAGKWEKENGGRLWRLVDYLKTRGGSVCGSPGGLLGPPSDSSIWSTAHPQFFYLIDCPFQLENSNRFALHKNLSFSDPQCFFFPLFVHAAPGAQVWPSHQSRQQSKNSFKVVFLGKSGVGKTSVTLRFCRDMFLDGTEATIGYVNCDDRFLDWWRWQVDWRPGKDDFNWFGLISN